jgi:hypothetical protein
MSEPASKEINANGVTVAALRKKVWHYLISFPIAR